MFNKTQIFNLALSSLFLTKRISDAETDNSAENIQLSSVWDISLNSALQEMDLDSTSMTKVLELVLENPDNFWAYAYKYPNDCAFLRRIVSCEVIDDNETTIDRKTQMIDYNGDIIKCIMTNQSQASVEYISNKIPLSSLSAEAATFIALKLALNAAPLITGKNSDQVIKQLSARYTMALMSAKSKDLQETSIYQHESMVSEFVKARMS